MKNSKQLGALFMALIFLFVTMVTTITATAAPVVPKPIPKISGIKTSYMVGEKTNLSITSKATKNVKYKVFLINETTKKVTEIKGDFSKKIYKPTQPCTVSLLIKQAGKYTLKATAYLSGFKDSYSSSSTTKFSISDKKPVIQSIDIKPVTINAGENIIYPVKVTAKMKDGTTKELDALWDNKITTGIPGNYTINGKVLGFNFPIKFLVTILDNSISSVDPIIANVEEGSEYKLPLTSKVILANRSTKEVTVKWNITSVDTKKPGTYTYEGTIENFDGKLILTLTVNPVKLAVEKISSDNLKEITVKYNKALSLPSAINQNIRLYKNSSLLNTTIKLSEDMKSLIICASSGTNFETGREHQLVIEKLKDLNGNELASSTTKIIPTDVTIPQVTDVKFTGSSTLTIEFSEPIKDMGVRLVEVKAGNSVLGVSSSYKGFETNKIIVELYNALLENTNYDISVRGFKDYAGYENVAKTFQLTFKKDTSPITAEVNYATQTYAVIKFSKPVSGIVKEMFYHNFASWTSIGIFTNAEMSSPVYLTTETDKLWIKFYDPISRIGNLITENTVKLNILGKVFGNEIKDTWGNKFSDVALPITVTVDKTPAVMTSLQVLTESSLILDFDEDVSFSTANIEVFDSSMLRVPIVVTSSNAKQYTISLGKSYAGNTLKVNINNVYDKAIVPNLSMQFTQNIFVPDKTPPQVQKVMKKIVPGLEQAIYISFNEAVSETALDSQNYYVQNTVNDQMSNLTIKPSYFSGNTIIKVPLTNEQKTMFDNGYNLFIRNIQDTSGNVLAGQIIKNSLIPNYDSAESKPKVTRLQVTDKRTLIVTFNQKLSRIDPGAFVVNGALPTDIASSQDAAGNTVVTAHTAVGKEFSGDINSVVSVFINNDATNHLENIFGVAVEAALYSRSTAIQIEDSIPPMIKIVGDKPQVFAQANAQGYINAVVIEYEKDINTNKLSALSFNVDGRTVTKVYTNATPNIGTPTQGRYVVIELKTDGVIQDTAARLLVTQVLDVYDMNDIKASPDQRIIYSLDKALPAVINRVTGQIGINGSVNLRFSESLSAASKLIVQSAITTGARGKGVLNFSWASDNILVITNTSTTEATSFQQGVPVKANISDMEGNITVEAILVSF